MPRRRQEEENLHTGRWVISYADFITLLFAFFVVMYATSSVNEEKYKQVADSLSGVFTGPQGVTERPLQGDADMNPAGVGIYTRGDAQTQAPTVKIVPPKPGNSAALQAIGEQMALQFKKLIREGHMAVQSNNLWVTIELGANLLFPEGGSLPAITADPVFERLARILKSTSNPIHVEGFTDDQLMSTDQFPSNWELSAARAASIVRILEMNGVEPNRMAAVGFGEYQPLADNSLEAGRRINRRIVIVVSRDRKTQRVVSAFGSQQVSEDAVSSLLSYDLPDASVEPQVGADGRVSFRRKTPVDELGINHLSKSSQTRGINPQEERQ